MKRPSWEGGYIRRGKKREVFIIEKWIGGLHFHISTRCTTRRAALEQLARFEADPVHYSPRGAGQGEAPVVLTAKLVLEYQDWMVKTKGVTPEWSYHVGRYLTDWTKELRDDGHSLDLRKMSLTQHVKPALARLKSSEKHRIEALKGFMSWMRREKGLIKHSEDATLDLPVPKANPAQRRKRRAVEVDQVRAVLPHLPEEAQDILILLMGTGWHVSEVRRFASDGLIEEPGRKSLATVSVVHKSGERHNTPIQHQEHLAAAKRIRARGAIPSPFALVRMMADACDAAGVEHFRLGVMRHTFATWARRSGATPQEISDFLGHKSKRTAELFYIGLGETAAIVPSIRTDPSPASASPSEPPEASDTPHPEKSPPEE